MIPVDLIPKDARLFATRADSDDVAAVKARDLLNRGRKVRFVTKISKTGYVTVEALDADPWAAGWQLYGRRLWFEQHPWMQHVLWGATALSALLWMFGKTKP